MPPFLLHMPRTVYALASLAGGVYTPRNPCSRSCSDGRNGDVKDPGFFGEAAERTLTDSRLGGYIVPAAIPAGRSRHRTFF